MRAELVNRLSDPTKDKNQRKDISTPKIKIVESTEGGLPEEDQLRLHH